MHRTFSPYSSLLSDLGLAYTGTLPTEIGLLTTLKYLQIALSNLNGTLPTEIGSLSELTTLRLPSNFLEGKKLSLNFFIYCIFSNDQV